MENRSFFNSPVIQKSTPMKRLGLSRKRKSSGSSEGLNTSNKISREKSPTHDLKTKANEYDTNRENTVDQLLNYEKELEAIKSRISQKEEKLKTLQNNNKNILELENLIELWKNGCKNSYLEFMQILIEKEPNVEARNVLNKLGIWETMLKHFDQDNDISLECSQ